MKKLMYFSLLLIFTVCVSNGFAQDTMNTETKTQTAKKNPDSKFMMSAATGGMNEIGLSNVALTKSTNEEVKQMAQKMIDDHTAANDELKTLAASKNVTLPTEMDSKHKAAMTKLEGLSGAEFDMEYVKWMVNDHEKAVSMFQKHSEKGKDAEAKAFAAKTLPTLQGHLEMAKNLMAKMSGKSAAMTEKMTHNDQ